ncbi:MAG: RNA 2',3'-cyclic phosphodiesterase [Dehalococcoidales bacterium]|jgi:2'-5' RNA ligase|nr:RNA 2',3'-cyclic phosphodiesterase [Dehalococcoidales bacterium]|tara:strand:- start:2465 stop:3067 length:603 start_codon:yes stop_codon:yes gene_type:complete
MEQARSFIAIELPDELKTGLSRLQAQLKTVNMPWVKWVNPDSIHLTLKFLGNVAIDRTDEITGAIETATRGISPFVLQVKTPGVFPNLRRVQVVWVGIGGEVDKLNRLQQQIESNLAQLGFAPESRSFTPHLTLARLSDRASPDERQRFGQLIADTRFEEAYTVKVGAINLMKSQLTREGAIHRRISSVELKKPLSTATS